MKKIAGFTIVAALCLAAATCDTASGGSADRSAFDEEAARLTGAMGNRLAKVSAVHRFVRDEIRQVKTRYS